MNDEESNYLHVSQHLYAMKGGQVDPDSFLMEAPC